MTLSQLFKEATLYTPPSTLAFDHVAKRPRKAISTGAQGTNHIEIHNHLSRDHNQRRSPPLDVQLGQRNMNADISHSDSDESTLISYPPISKVLTDLHAVMPLIDYPCFEEALVKNGVVYANSVLNINTDFFSTIVVLRFDGPFGPQWFSRVKVESRNKTKVGLSRAKSFGADLGGNKSNHSSSRQ